VAQIVSQIPTLIDRVWDLYVGALAPFVHSLDAGNNPLGYRQSLSHFMAVSLQHLWQQASFHERKLEVLDAMLYYLVSDPMTVASLYQRLNWEFIFTENDPFILISFVKMYMDVQLLCSPQQNQVIAIQPPHLRDYIETLDSYDRETLWQKITSEAFIRAFSGQTVRRLLYANMAQRDPS
jgi:hypothetical protein